MLLLLLITLLINLLHPSTLFAFVPFVKEIVLFYLKFFKQIQDFTFVNILCLHTLLFQKVNYYIITKTNEKDTILMSTRVWVPFKESII